MSNVPLQSPPSDEGWPAVGASHAAMPSAIQWLFGTPAVLIPIFFIGYFGETIIRSLNVAGGRILQDPYAIWDGRFIYYATAGAVGIVSAAVVTWAGRSRFARTLRSVPRKREGATRRGTITFAGLCAAVYVSLHLMRLFAELGIPLTLTAARLSNYTHILACYAIYVYWREDARGAIVGLVITIMALDMINGDRRDTFLIVMQVGIIGVILQRITVKGIILGGAFLLGFGSAMPLFRYLREAEYGIIESFLTVMSSGQLWLESFGFDRWLGVLLSPVPNYGAFSTMWTYYEEMSLSVRKFTTYLLPTAVHQLLGTEPTAYVLNFDIYGLGRPTIDTPFYSELFLLSRPLMILAPMLVVCIVSVLHMAAGKRTGYLAFYVAVVSYVPYSFRVSMSNVMSFIVFNVILYFAIWLLWKVMYGGTRQTVSPSQVAGDLNA